MKFFIQMKKVSFILDKVQTILGCVSLYEIG